MRSQTHRSRLALKEMVPADADEQGGSHNRSSQTQAAQHPPGKLPSR
jgi:hypothetical protein